MIKRQRITITGRVQGVGFRPAVYKIARSLGLTGFVYNDTKGVTIELQGEPDKITSFLIRLNSSEEKPPMAEIKTCSATEIAVIESQDSFFIKDSDSQGTPLSQVTADIATCADCLNEMVDVEDFRYEYPFINCTNCGPRYSIIKTIPYDRPNTTMSIFKMCEKCAAQYSDVADRRFHAQPVACPACGPHIWLTDNKGRIVQEKSDKAIAETAGILLSGKIVAIKGLGGFHLAVNPLDNEAVERLRERKRRDHKPFALMADSIETIKKYAIVSKSAEQVLRSPQSPIVLLPKRASCAIALVVAEQVETLGFMLCYTPLHHQLFSKGISVLVMTSGNVSDEPLICKNDDAMERLGDIADAFLMHNREIYRQVDDSIIHFIAQKPVLLRRARGYVPTPVSSPTMCRVDIFAAGADLKNTFCFAKRNQLICSEHIGDLEDTRVYRHYIDSIGHLAGLFEVEPQVVACDLHPGYFSTRYSQSLKGKKIIPVQHHWAHVASVLAENNISGPVIGIVCDGTGYGTDGAIWGFECLIASLERFERFGHLDYYQLPGGDKASKEAVRPALSLLKKAFGGEFSLKKFDWLLSRIEPDSEKLQVISQQLEKNINCVATSSLGRVFDAVAAIIGIGVYNHFDAQLPMALEAIADAQIEDCYQFDIPEGRNRVINIDNAIKQIVEDVQSKIEKSTISAKFHNTLIAAMLKIAEKSREQTNLNTVALSGGVFCNRYLLKNLTKKLGRNGFSVLINQRVPSNDGGISLGQAAIAVTKAAGRA